MEQKICKKCQQEKSIEMMACKRKSPVTGLQLYKNVCKVCDNIRVRERKRGTDKEKLRNTKYRLKTKYGITIEDYNFMKNNQDGKCMICGNNYKLHVDHCHDTGKIRGLLCNGCNIGLGQFKDNIENLKKAIKYLENNK